MAPRTETPIEIQRFYRDLPKMIATMPLIGYVHPDKDIREQIKVYMSQFGFVRASEPQILSIIPYEA